MDREKVMRALIDWNFWYKEQFTGHPREYTEEVLKVLRSGFVADLVGVKRSGKSTIMNQVVKRLLETGVDPLSTLIVNFEDSRLWELDDANKLFQLLDVYREETGVKGRPYIFLDEVQRVRGWEGFVRSLVDRKEAFVTVTGSTSALRKGKVKEVLAGRHVSLEVTPLSFREFLLFKGFSLRSPLDLRAREVELKTLFLEYLRYGGFPAVVESDLKERILMELYDDILGRDVVEGCRIREVGKLRALSLFYVTNVGNRVSLRRISRSLGIPLRTVERFTACLQEAMLVYFLPPLSPSFSEMVKGERKVYSVDQGLSNVVGYRLNQNLGSLLENVVYLELRRRYGEGGLFYYRGKREVDFLVVRDNEVREAYQVTYNLADERELDGLREVLRRKKVEAKLLTLDEEGDVMGVKVRKVWKWLLGFD
ncbi:MAG: ATP-binding protein [Metallosphaera yellowstonensis]|jgi:predicted AAA+ superfamily ATPase|uniref:Putative ATPase (AAA+ superfamily) n=2 Tax=Metallosphaera yellowstonensis MK1 TaxID=671065 RepID=H2C4T4_9CREN|nr:ATP-binding protein [Metallosphaera yellowstonensis]EHP69876.1 putative ATPase (AAA+ superfamily) [Metallosphaera yellowstonensis MK1]